MLALARVRGIVCCMSFGASLAHVLRKPIRLNSPLPTCTFLNCAFISSMRVRRMMMKSTPCKRSAVSEWRWSALSPIILWNKMREKTRLEPSSTFWLPQSESCCVSQRLETSTKTANYTTQCQTMAPLMFIMLISPLRHICTNAVGLNKMQPVWPVHCRQLKMCNSVNTGYDKKQKVAQTQ